MQQILIVQTFFMILGVKYKLKFVLQMNSEQPTWSHKNSQLFYDVANSYEFRHRESPTTGKKQYLSPAPKRHWSESKSY